MSGAGAGATWFGRNHQISLTTAWPTGATEKNIEPQRSPRIWLQATRYF